MAHRTLTRSYLHRGGTTPLVGLTIDEFFREMVDRFPDRDAVVALPQKKRLTYRDLDGEVQRVAKALLALRVKKGDRVGIWATDNAEWILLQLATARIGAILVNINPAYRTAELRHAMKLAEVQSLFLIPRFRSSDYVGMVREVCPEVDERPADTFTGSALPNLHHIVVYDPEDLGRAEPPHKGMHTWAEFLSRADGVSDEQITERAGTLDVDDPVNIQFTSGTTGFPKAVTLTHHNIVNNGYFVGEAMGFTEKDRLCVPLPFYHCFGMVVANLACLTHGSAIVIPSDHFEAGVTLAAIASERCTAVHGVPTMFVAELDHPDFETYDLSSLRTGIMAGAPCPPELMKRVMHVMGCREILIGFGQTEASPITHMTARDDDFDKRVNTVGTNFPHQECKVVDPATGDVMPIGEPGEVCFRGYNVMRGYYNQPEATAQAIDPQGWLHSGDLGVMDADGYLKITGRLKDMIIRGGENIYPAEIEAFYYEHPKISEIAVFGIPHPDYGEEVGAWVRLQEGETADAEELREHAKGKIAHYKIPKHIWIVDEFPMTVTGKIQKNRIRETVAQWMHAKLEEEKQGTETAGV